LVPCGQHEGDETEDGEAFPASAAACGGMSVGQLPSFEQMLVIKRELNELLWTADAPEVPGNVPRFFDPRIPVERESLNIQCTGHTVIATGLFMGMGFRVTTRVGMAFILEKGSAGDRVNQIAKHLWITLADHGLVDLSLHGETEHPLVYCSREPTGRWSVGFGEDTAQVKRFIEAGRQGCFYMTLNKKTATEEDLKEALGKPFPGAKKAGVELHYGRIVEHCERLLADTEVSLVGVPQKEAWARLAARSPI
jgi:hypothetical protein